MTTVADAERIIQSETTNYGTELVPFERAMGRVLASDLVADRDLPPCNRVTMDGIAISYAAFERGIRAFTIKATLAAGDKPTDIEQASECVEIMTGAALPDTTDTVIRYEDVMIADGIATITIDSIRKGQNIHPKGKDKNEGDIVIPAGCIVDATTISMAASVGVSLLPVSKLPGIVIISTGDELVDINAEPSPYQVRRSNSYTIKAALQQYATDTDMLHIPDNYEATKVQISDCLAKYDILLLSGGISMGKFDYVPQALEELGVIKLFHKVQQRPGKPFWFGRHTNGALVFAFPGNPVSTFMCLHRYFIPWLEASLQIQNAKNLKPKNAVLNIDVSFAPALQYFMQVNVTTNELGQLIATPTEGNGSGDYANLIDSNAFMELPMEQSNFTSGEAYRIWPFKPII